MNLDKYQHYSVDATAFIYPSSLRSPMTPSFSLSGEVEPTTMLKVVNKFDDCDEKVQTMKPPRNISDGVAVSECILVIEPATSMYHNMVPPSRECSMYAGETYSDVEATGRMSPQEPSLILYDLTVQLKDVPFIDDSSSLIDFFVYDTSVKFLGDSITPIHSDSGRCTDSSTEEREIEHKETRIQSDTFH